MIRNQDRVVPEEENIERVLDTEEPMVEQEENRVLIQIKYQIFKLIRLSMTLLVSAVFLVVSLQFGGFYSIAVTPFIVLDLQILSYNSFRIFKREQQILNRLVNTQIYESVQTAGTLGSKILAVLWEISNGFHFLITLIPMCFSMIIRLFMKKRNRHECQSFTNIFWFIGRWTRLICLLCIGLKLEKEIDWSWTEAFWPIWVIVCLLTLVSIGISLLTLGTFFSFIVGQSSLFQLISTIWLLYITSGTTFSLAVFFMTLSEIDTGLSASQATLIPIFLLILFIIFTLATYKILLQQWDIFLTTRDDQIEYQVPPSLPTQLVNALKRPPKALIRLSSTYFQPADSSSILPQNRRTNSQQPQVVQIRSHQRFFSHELRPPSVHLQRTPSNYILNSSTNVSFIEKSCTICCQASCNAVIMDCGHGGVCYQCAINIWKTRGLCHMCRRPLSQVLQIKLEPSKVLKVLSSTRAIQHKQYG